MLINILKDYSDSFPFMLAKFLVPVESSVYYQVSYLVIPTLVATQKTHCNTYITIHTVYHNAPK